MCFCNVLEGWNKLTEDQRIAIKKQADLYHEIPDMTAPPITWPALGTYQTKPIRIDTETNMEVIEKACGKLEYELDPEPFAWLGNIDLNKEN